MECRGEKRREIGAELNNYILMARYANVPGVALEDAFLPLLLLFPRVTSVQHLSLFHDYSTFLESFGSWQLPFFLSNTERFEATHL